MGGLLFIGLGLHDEKGISLQGLEAARSCDLVFAEFYTSKLTGTNLASLERTIGKSVHVLTREEVEDGRKILDAARDRRVAFLVPGDPMAATTHVDLRLQAAARSIPTRILPGASILTAAAGVLGLQAYKFGRTTTVPFPTLAFRPTSPLETVLENRRAGLHTLVLLDIREDGMFLDPKSALRQLLGAAKEVGATDFGPTTLACVVSGAGSLDAQAAAGTIEDLFRRDLGPPLHSIVIPGPLHFLEKEALIAFAGAPKDL